MIYDQNDLDSMATCIWKEARSLGTQGMTSVGCVICNRVGAPGFAKTVHDVIYGKNQFTSMSVPSDPEFNLQPTGPSYIQAQEIAHFVLEGTQPDVTLGSHYYEVEGTVNHWFDTVIKGDPINHPFTVRIGTQLFYV